MSIFRLSYEVKNADTQLEDVPIEGDTSGRFKNKLPKYVDIHKNRRCFVVGNGPSLNKIDMSLLENEITLGSNRVYLGFKKWGFHFTYWGIEDFLQIKQSYKEFSNVLPEHIIKFVPKQYCYLFNCKNIVPINFLYIYDDYPKFSNDSRELYLGFTVTYMLLQIAVIMGCNPIYLIGVDHSFNIAEKDIVDGTWTDPESKSHFISNYCGADNGIIWNLPQFDRSNSAYRCAGDWAKQNNRQILNAAPGSKLEVFPMVPYKEIF